MTGRPKKVAKVAPPQNGPKVAKGPKRVAQIEHVLFVDKKMCVAAAEGFECWPSVCCISI